MIIIWMGEFVKDLVACTSVTLSFHHATIKFASNIMTFPNKNHNIAHEAPTKACMVEVGTWNMVDQIVLTTPRLHCTAQENACRVLALVPKSILTLPVRLSTYGSFAEIGSTKLPEIFFVITLQQGCVTHIVHQQQANQWKG